MPELPEVETVVRSLTRHIVNHQILGVSVTLTKIVSGNGTKRLNDPKIARNFESKIINKMVTNITRRAKNIMINLDDGSLLLSHLKMTGKFLFYPKSSDSPKIIKHNHIILNFQHGDLVYNDIRQFGYVLYFDNIDEAKRHFELLGLEPLDKSFTLLELALRLSNKKTSLKSLLLSQKVVVGIGNIYADEICFEAQILPNRVAGSLTDSEVARVFGAIIKILEDAILHGGSSISDYLDAEGNKGTYVSKHRVYGRAGLECFRCGNVISKVNLAGRTTTFCSNCQY